jgi:MFS family permease
MSQPPTDDSHLAHDAYAALRIPEFRRFWAGNFLAILGSQMQFVAIGWDIYERTGQTLQLGLVGLVQVIPVILLALPAGQVIDRLDRRHVIMAALAIMVACSLALAGIAWQQADYRWIYGCLFLNGVARAFLQPGKSALLPLIVPRSRFTNAVTWSTSGFQLATVIGPAAGGLVIAVTGAALWVYLLDAALGLAFVIALSGLRPRAPAASHERIGVQSLFAGAAFVWRTKLILGAVSLDMFAVLLGGATALLPVYAKVILHSGADGLGWLRAAPGLGALLTSYILTHRGPIQRAGRTMLWSVIGFGCATVVFGLSRSFWLAWPMLFLTGACDMVSVVIRHSLIQLWTPDAMRGRVSAVNGMFIGISNELGEFESGTVAHWFERPGDPAFGPTVSVVSGGLGTVLVVLMSIWLFPAMRRHGRLDETTTNHTNDTNEEEKTS